MELEVKIVDWASDVEVRWEGTIIGFGRGGAGHYIPIQIQNMSQLELIYHKKGKRLRTPR